MAQLQVCYEGENHFILVLFGALSVRDTTLRLYTNDITPSNSDLYATYTECSATGYSSKTLSRGSWTITQGSGSTKTYCSYNSEQSFTFAGYTGSGVYVYGYYITFNDGSNRLLGAERFEARQYITSTTTIKITPIIQLGDLST